MTLSPARRLAAAAAVALLIGSAFHLVRGDRYRLYTHRQAARCWDAVVALAPPTSSLRLASVDVADGDAGSGTEVVVGYRMDRVLAGLVLEARCSYPAGSPHPSTIVVNGEPVDPARFRD